MDVLPPSSKTLNTFGITMGLVFFGTLVFGLNLGSILILGTKQAQVFGKYLQASMIHVGESCVGDSWAKKGKVLKDTDEAENLVRRGKKVPAELWYTWYCVMWLMFLLPANELYDVGGLRGLVSKVGYVRLKSGAKPSKPEKAWAITIIPLRVLLLPLHAVTISIDYVLLVVFSGALLGWKVEDSASKDLHSEYNSNLKQASIQTIDSSAGRESTSTIESASPWVKRFTDPISILKKIPECGLCPPSKPKKTKASYSDVGAELAQSLDTSGNPEFSASTMDLLFQKIVRTGKGIGLDNPGASLKSSYTEPSPHTRITVEIPSPETDPSHTFHNQPHDSQLSQLHWPEQPYLPHQDHTLPMSLGSLTPPAKFHIPPGKPFFPRTESAPVRPSGSWEAAFMGRGHRSRESEADPEKGERKKKYVVGG